MTGDGWDWLRAEQRAARDEQWHRPHPLDCRCRDECARDEAS